MLPMDVTHRCGFVVKIVILFYGMFHMCSGLSDPSSLKKVLFVSTQTWNPQPTLASGCVSEELCFNVSSGKNAECCDRAHFNCNFEIKDLTNNAYSLNLKKEILSKQDIVVIVERNPGSCIVNQQEHRPGFHLNIHECLHEGQKYFRLSKDGLCGKKRLPYDKEACKGLQETSSQYKVTISSNKTTCVSCKPPGKPDISITVPVSDSSNTTSPEKAVNIVKNLSSLVEQMGDSSTASITIGQIKGVIAKLPQQNQPNLTFGLTATGDINLFEESSGFATNNFSRSVQIPEEASAMAVKRNGSYAGLLLFPGMSQDDPDSVFLNNEVVAIEMGAKISNLSQTIDIEYSNVNKSGNIVSCRSWDGEGGKPNWITDGCRTKVTNDSITCQCSHLTFFAILLSPPPAGNISASDLNSLNYITKIGCGMSMFFLAVALFMHCLVRKVKASQGTHILINLFVAMFTLNLSFLVNESIANLRVFAACVATAAVLHYSMLATFTWFFMQALHLYFNLTKIPTDVTYYMSKICIAGWVTPALAVIVLLALQKYDFLVINTNDGNSAKMCWITDAAVHQGVNVGYYAVVFIFTFSIFIVTVCQIFRLKPAAEKTSSTKTNAFSILGLFLLLGITWAFAFFSHGPLLLPSYYIFTILNSFQGFFLFIYYYRSSKIVGEDMKLPQSSSSSTATSNTAVENPYE